MYPAGFKALMVMIRRTNKVKYRKDIMVSFG